MRKVSAHPKNCEQCHRPAAVTLVTLAPIHDNPPARWLCRKCKGPASEAMKTHLAAQARALKTKPIAVPTRSRKVRIFDRERGACFYCGISLEIETATLDHAMPKARGGASTDANLVLCCKPCNQEKGCQTPEEAGMHWWGKVWPCWQIAQEARHGTSRWRALESGAGC